MKKSIGIIVMFVSICLALVFISDSSYHVFGLVDQNPERFSYSKEEEILLSQLAHYKNQLKAEPRNAELEDALLETDFIFDTLKRFEAYAQSKWQVEHELYEMPMDPTEKTKEYERLELKITAELIGEGNAVDAKVIKSFKALNESRAVSEEMVQNLRNYYELRKNAIVYHLLNP